MSYVGNPQYTPDYEKYYQPELERWLDYPISPANQLWIGNRFRRVARDLGPVLPIVAVAGPLIATAYAGYKTAEQYRLDKERAARIDRVKAAATARLTNRKLEKINEELRESTKAIQLLPYNIRRAIKGVPPSGEQSESESYSYAPAKEHTIYEESEEAEEYEHPMPPESLKHSVHVNFHDREVYKKRPRVSNYERDENAKGVMSLIKEFGLDAIRRRKELKLYDRNILFGASTFKKSIKAALLGENYFPEPYKKFLDQETINSYRPVGPTKVKPKPVYDLMPWESKPLPGYPPRRIPGTNIVTRSLPMQIPRYQSGGEHIFDHPPEI